MASSRRQVNQGGGFAVSSAVKGLQDPSDGKHENARITHVNGMFVPLRDLLGA